MVAPVHLQTDLRAALHLASSAARSLSLSFPRAVSFSARLSPLGLRALSAQVSSADVLKSLDEKPPVCTADELHFVSVQNSDWRLALWRYLPPPQAPARKHPLLLLSGVGTNAIGYDLSPEKLMDEVTSPNHPLPEEFMHPRDDDDDDVDNVVEEDDDDDRKEVEGTKSSWL